MCANIRCDQSGLIGAAVLATLLLMVVVGGAAKPLRALCGGPWRGVHACTRTHSRTALLGFGARGVQLLHSCPSSLVSCSHTLPQRPSDCHSRGHAYQAACRDDCGLLCACVIPCINTRCIRRPEAPNRTAFGSMQPCTTLILEYVFGYPTPLDGH